METASLKNFATWARTELITQVSARIAAVLAPASPERTENPRAIRSLESDIHEADDSGDGKNTVADKVAYTWFNRIIALRFMDAHGYTAAGVVSPAVNESVGQPEILADAKRGIFDPDIVNARTAEVVSGLIDGTRSSTDSQGEAYTLLLAAYCRYWNKSMPFMFEPEGDYTELLIPANLLADNSILARALTTLTPEVCQDVEVIGWLYQFYISERKDEVFAGFKRNIKAGAAEIPAATQLFTPHWIVQYLVENSVGRLWMLNHPESHLVEKMKYYIAPIDEETDYLKLNGPEELTVIDPACGSGHMLTYAFDVLYAIYEEEGYSPSKIPGLILAHNLFGTEIDPRAAALAAFALTMKARAKQRTFFRKSVQANICVISPITFRKDELDLLVTRDGNRSEEELFWNQFEHADVFGSLIQPDPELTAQLAAQLTTLDSDVGIFLADTLDRANRVVEQAGYLSHRYTVAVANPPYMGGKQMNAVLSRFMKDTYPTGKADLMTAFMLRSEKFTVRNGTWAMINLPSWMSLKSFEDLRRDLLQHQRIVSMAHLGRGIFGSDFGTVAFVIDNAAPNSARGVYRRLFEQHVDVRSVATIERLFLDREYNRFEASQGDFDTIPGSPIVYWLSEKMITSFVSHRSLGEVSDLRQGLATTNNGRFTRYWWEISNNHTAFSCGSREEASATKVRWFPYNKGGEFRRWYGNQELVVDWDHDGRHIKMEIARKYPYLNGNVDWVAKNQSSYFSPSVSWSDISSGAPSFRSFPRGFIHGNKGNSLFGSSSLLVRLLGVMNAPIVTVILEALTPTMTATVGDVSKTPIPDKLPDLQPSRIESLVAMARNDWDESEVSWNFSSNPLVRATLV